MEPSPKRPRRARGSAIPSSGGSPPPPSSSPRRRPQHPPRVAGSSSPVHFPDASTPQSASRRRPTPSRGTPVRPSVPSSGGIAAGTPPIARSSSPVRFGLPGTPGTPSASIPFPGSQTPRADLAGGRRASARLATPAPPSGRGLTTDDARGSVFESDRDEAVIWGTTVNLERTSDEFKAFFRTFTEPDTDGPFYEAVLDQMHLIEQYFLNLDCSRLEAYDAANDTSLYTKLVKYPQEVVPIIDLVIHDLYVERFPHEEAPPVPIQVRPFRLGEIHTMRDLNPNDVDCLVAVRGIVIRCSTIIPDLKSAFFKCTVCNAAEAVVIHLGRIEQPQKCKGCNSTHTYELIHNRSLFSDKQVVRLQEAPESIPEGETPQQVTLFCYGSMVDVMKPGDRVEVTGVFRATPVRPNPKQRRVNAVFRTYIDAIHVRRSSSGRLQAVDVDGDADGEEAVRTGFEEDDKTQAIDDAMEQQILELSRQPDLYRRLQRSLAPSIWGMDEVKRGVLLMMFGGTNKVFGEETHDQEEVSAITSLASGGPQRSLAAGAKFRGEINILMVGDPGTSKSQMLSYVHKVAPRGVYTSGKGSSAVGLTAYIQKDPDTGELVLESGALVLSDRGICCIDEFDKMGDGTRAMLHEAMEQQTVSIAKAGIICSLNARASVLASANPLGSRYDDGRSVVENINLPPTLLSRFDLIYLVLDLPDAKTDRALARHLVALYHHGEAKIPLEAGLVDLPMLAAYVSYAKRKSNPKITESAASALIEGYVKMRQAGGGRGTISATPRQLESLIRLAEAHARMRLSDVVESRDVDEAVSLVEEAIKQAWTDKTTGKIDMGGLLNGMSEAERGRMQGIRQAVQDLLRARTEHTIQFRSLLEEINRTASVSISKDELRDVLERLKSDEVIAMIGLQANPTIRRL